MRNIRTVLLIVVLLTGMASVAQAIPAKLLPNSTTADVACGNLVDEAKLLAELQAWQKHYNNMLRSMEKMSEKELYRFMVETIWTPLEVHWGNLFSLLEPVLERWELNKTTPQDTQVLHIMERYGIAPVSVEGCPDIKADINFFRARFTYPPAAEAFIALQQAQPSVYTSSHNTLSSPCADIVTWLIQWEQLIQNNPTQPWREAAQIRYFYLLNLLLFHTDHESRVNAQELDVNDWRQALQQGIAAHPDTLTAVLFKTALDKTNATTCIIPQDAKKSILARAKAGLSDTKGKAKSAKP